MQHGNMNVKQYQYKDTQLTLYRYVRQTNQLHTFS